MTGRVIGACEAEAQKRAKETADEARRQGCKRLRRTIAGTPKERLRLAKFLRERPLIGMLHCSCPNQAQPPENDHNATDEGR